MRASTRHLPYAGFASCCLPVPAILFSLCAHASLFPHTYYVGAGAKCDFSQIQDAIQAASATAGDVIVIDGGQTYSGQHLTIAGKSLTLKAGPCGGLFGGTTPSALTANPQVTISGNDGASSAVLTITGTGNVTLVDLKFADNQNSGYGGGIEYSGVGTLTLTNVALTGNSANDGGGIDFHAPGDDATLVLDADTQIIANTANGGDTGSTDDNRGGGGGVRVDGHATLTVTAARVLVSGNHAPTGYGGGIEVVGPATAYIGSTGGFTAVINDNDAAYGGGIAVMGGFGNLDDATVYAFTADATRPVGITNNTASHTGGGVYVKPYQDFSGSIDFATFCGQDFQIESNVAVQGAAIYADTDSALGSSPLGGYVQLGYSCGGGSPDAVACTNTAACNTVNGNSVTDPTGSAILIQSSGLLQARRFSMGNNTADHAIRVIGDDSNATLVDCVIANNTIAHELIHVAGNNTPLKIESCTLANDTINAAHVIHTESDLTLLNDIIHETGTLALDYSGDPAKLKISYVLSNDVSTLPDSAGTGIALGSPEFVDAVDGDLHLKPTSLGVDFAPATGDFLDTADLDGNPRAVDLSSAGDVYGFQDLGAYELQNGFRECGAQDSYFCDGFDH